jgi:hypothetical protein
MIPMKNAFRIGAALTVTVIAAIAVSRYQQPVTPPVAGRADPSPVAGTIHPGAVSVTAPAPRTEPSQPAEAGTTAAAERTVEVTAGQVLATINNRPIRGQDLVAMGANGQPVRTSPKMYKFLLARAVERELTFQAARTQGVTLDEEQQRRLEEVRAQREADLKSDLNGQFVQHLNLPGSVEDQIAFETRDAESRLLMNRLAEQAGVPSPYVTEEMVRAYYSGHAGEYAGRALEDVDLEIRAQLSPKVQAAYQEALRAYIKQLKGAAQIALAKPSA